ncbi:MAG: GUN4 domain-containing protein [Stenomitos frigidus ULC029]
MNRTRLVGVLACLLAGSATPLVFLPTVLPKQASLDRAVAASPSASTAPSHRDVFYLSDRFGFRTLSPSGYIITPSETKPSTKPAVPLQVLELWQQADFMNRESLPEAPPIIRITVYNNVKQLPLTHWKGELSRKDDRPLTVAGQTAIAYSSTGLYDSDNVLFYSPDRRYVFRITVGYADAKAPIRQTFQELLASFTFDVSPNPKSASKWRINYSRLQHLLAAKNWQAADIETRAILQRLASPKGDLLFSSKGVLSRLPWADLRTIDTLWSNASGGRFGFTAQQRVWQQAAKGSRNVKEQTERFAQTVGWRRTKPLPNNDALGIEFSAAAWLLDTELNITATAPPGHFPWAGVSSSRVSDYINDRALGCGSCTIDAMYLSGDRYFDYLPALFARLKATK